MSQKLFEYLHNELGVTALVDQMDEIKRIVMDDCKGEEPTPEQFGWHNQNGFDDEPIGWMFEGGEDAYYEAVKKWNELKIK